MQIAMKRGISRGGVLVMMLVILAMFVVITIATAAYLDRQYGVTVDQEQEERSFHVTEAGVHYALFLLNRKVYTTQEMITNSPIVHTVTQESINVGTATLTSVQLGVGPNITLTVDGRDASLNRCQTLVVNIQKSGGEYRVTRWDHAVPCGGY